ncbi:hypothetical protein [Microvirga sp. M2]|uniref:hypothetical protein n=1 Tax=Microvirga sp. M2 TaxID=3073270 RepID=UPI0039C388EF
MFGYQGDERQATVTRKTGYRDDAKRQWNCLSTMDLSRTKNEQELISLVKVRDSLPDETAKADVEG